MPAELGISQASCAELSHSAMPGPRDARKLVWFLVPSWDIAGGGVMSICRFYAETEMLFRSLGVTVVASVYPNAATLRKYTRFENSMDIFSFSEIVTHFNRVEHLILQIPEYFCKDFVSSLSPSERLFLDTIPRLHINMMLQNIDQCDPGDIAPLRILTDEITCTTAHDRYSTQEQSARFGIPLHRLSVFVDHYEQHRWAEKNDIIVLSPDPHPLRDQVIDIIAKGLPHVELITVADMPYETYRSLIARAKWSLTFGEGLDGFFAEMALTGGVPFAVYNDRFFMPEFRDFPTVYDTWDDLRVSIVKDILNLDNDHLYRAAGEPIRKALNLLYNSEKYRENIRLFYDERYSFSGTNPLQPRRDNELLARARQAVAGIKQRERALAEALEARDARIAQLGQALETRDAIIAQLGQELEARNATIAQLGQTLEAANATIAQFREAIDARDANIAQLNTNIAQMREFIETRDASIKAEIAAYRESSSWKLTAPMRSTVQLVRSSIAAIKTVGRRVVAGSTVRTSGH